MIDDITIDFLSSWNFTSMEDIIRKCNKMVDLLKFTFNKKNIIGVVVLVYNQTCCQILFKV